MQASCLYRLNLQLELNSQSEVYLWVKAEVAKAVKVE